MASQTGTLKFRQSDGTYTELYPKTTIAQVDGLQTQLDSINTSLQNKVDLTTTNEQHINSNLVTTYPYRFSVVDNQTTQAFFGIYGYHYDGGVSISSSYTENNETYFSILGVNKERVEYLVQKRVGTVLKDEVLATQSYVTNQIQGAINAAY